MVDTSGGVSAMWWGNDRETVDRQRCTFKSEGFSEAPLTTTLATHMVGHPKQDTIRYVLELALCVGLDAKPTGQLVDPAA